MVKQNVQSSKRYAITTQMRIYKTNIYVWVIAGFFVCFLFIVLLVDSFSIQTFEHQFYF